MLGQARPASTDFALLRKFDGNEGAGGVLVIIANTTGGAVNATLCLSRTQSWDESNAIIFAKSVPANDKIEVEIAGALEAGSTLGFKSSAASSLTATALRLIT